MSSLPRGPMAVRRIPAPFRLHAPGGLHSCVPIVKPGLSRVRVPTNLPESLLILRQKLDLPDPFRAFPRIELRRNHADGAAVLAWQRTALPSVHEQHIIVDSATER